MGRKPGAARRIALVALVALVTAMPLPSGSADWLTDGANPARTGLIAGAGPAEGDVSYQLQVPGPLSGEFVIRDGILYSAVNEYGAWEDPSPGLYAFTLDTGEVRLVVAQPEGAVFGAVQDGLYLIMDPFRSPDPNEQVWLWRIQAFDLTGKHVWDVQFEEPDVLPFGMVVPDLFVAAGHLHIAYHCCNGRAYVATYNTTSGDLIGKWDRNGLGGLANTPPDQDAPLPPQAMARNQRLAYHDGRLYSLLTSVYPGPQVGNTMGDLTNTTIAHSEIWALEAPFQQAAWARSTPPRAAAQAAGLAPLGPAELNVFGGGAPAVDDRAVYARLGDLVALNPKTGALIWSQEVGVQDQLVELPAFTIGLHGDFLVAATAETLYRLDAVTGAIQWQRVRSSDGSSYSLYPIVSTQHVGYAHTFHAGEYLGYGIEAFNLTTGAKLWEWKYLPTIGVTQGFNGDIGSFAVDGELAVLTSDDGILTVIGQTAASVGFPDLPSSIDVEPGENVTLDLSGGAPGLTGPATEYRVDWGDGEPGEWQPEPIFQHNYQAGAFVAQFHARNAAGHSATRTIDVTVAAPVPAPISEPVPTKPSVFRDPFAAGNQDMTFGVLGIALVLVGGVLGLWRARRHRRQVNAEMEALEAAHDAAASDDGWQRAVTAARMRWRGLHKAGRLTDSQVDILGRRAEELSRNRRLTVIETELAFLPHSLVKTLHKLLRDGHITAHEKDTILRSVDADTTMTAGQKRKVRIQMATWADIGPG